MIQDEIGKLVPDEQKDFNFDLIYGGESTPGKNSWGCPQLSR
jgi:DNA polymerase III subunit delta